MTFGPKPKTLAERFWKKVNKNGPILRPELGCCWVWTGATSDCGYGVISLPREPGAKLAKKEQTHRVAWRLIHGEVPEGMRVLHHCDNPPCVRHLFLGTQDDNMKDAVAKRRVAHGEQHGMVKLTAAVVVAVRAAVAGGDTQSRIARELGVTPGAISDIVRHVNWAHLP